MDMSTAAVCAGCRLGEDQVGKLKQCAKCKTTSYCSRECQKADWKNHKKICATNAARFANGVADAARQNSSTSSDPAPTSPPQTTHPKNLDTPVDKPFHKLHDKTWLHGRSEKDVFKLLIDAYRMRMGDEFSFAGEAEVDSLYDGSPSGLPAFRRFLRLATSRPNLLPPWWTAQKATECWKWGMSNGGHYNLDCVIEKNDIQEYYGVQDMPMQLRMLGEQVYGTGPGGQSGTAMMQFKMAAEGGRIREASA